MKTISTNSVKAVVKKAPAKSESVILKSTINYNWKQATQFIRACKIRQKRRQKRPSKANQCDQQKQRHKRYIWASC